jgi:hypothetical protein
MCLILNQYKFYIVCVRDFMRVIGEVKEDNIRKNPGKNFRRHTGLKSV